MLLNMLKEIERIVLLKQQNIHHISGGSGLAIYRESLEENGTRAVLNNLYDQSFISQCLRY